MKSTLNNTSMDFMPSGKSYRATVGDKTVEVEILSADAGRGRLDLRIVRSLDPSSVENHPLSVSISVYVSSDGAKRWVTVNGQTFVLTKSSGVKRSGAGHDHASELAAPMPGQVRSVNVSAGEAVSKGQTLLVLEAMKMEIRIQAPRDGTVVELMVKVGQTVEREQILAKMDHG